MSTGGLVLVGSKPPSVSVSGHGQPALGPHHGFAFIAPRTTNTDFQLHDQGQAPDQSFGQTFTQTRGYTDFQGSPGANASRSQASSYVQNPSTSLSCKWSSSKSKVTSKAVKEAEKQLEKEAKKKQGPPLLWSPPPPDPEKVKQRLALGSRSLRFQTSADKWRVRHATPTFVDESLFGPRLQEPDFKPPWEDVKAVSKTRVWTPSYSLESQRERNLRAQTPKPRRPPSAGAAARRPQSADLSASQTRPIWKP